MYIRIPGSYLIPVASSDGIIIDDMCRCENHSNSDVEIVHNSSEQKNREDEEEILEEADEEYVNSEFQ